MIGKRRCGWIVAVLACRRAQVERFLGVDRPDTKMTGQADVRGAGESGRPRRSARHVAGDRQFAPAVGAAAVAVEVVTVVTLLDAGFDDAVAAEVLRAIVVTRIVILAVTVVALFPECDDAVATRGVRAIRVTAITVDE